MNREYHKWYSERLGRDMELLLYGHGGEPVLVLPTSRGRFFQAEDNGLIGAIEERIQAGRYTVVCADSVDTESWFNTSAPPHERLARHEQWEQYLLHEVVPLLRSRSTGGRLTLGGCSFGGFHTYNVGLRHPDVFQRLVAMGALFDTGRFLNGYQDESVYYHSCTQWLPGVTDAGHLAALRRVELVLAVGEHDFCRGENESLSKLLWSKDLSHQLAIWWGGAHDWAAWKQMIQQYLPG